MDVAAVQKLVDPMFPGTMGVKILGVEPERITAELMVRQGLCTTRDTLHGGAYMAFADTLGALGTIISLPKGARTSTIESKTNFLNGAGLGSRVTGETTAFHKGRNTMVWQTKVLREDGKLCAVVTQTQMVMPTGG